MAKASVYFGLLFFCLATWGLLIYGGIELVHKVVR